MNILLIDGHPDTGRPSNHLLDLYQAALSETAQLCRISIHDLKFDPNLAHGYARRTGWEPDLIDLAGKLESCDHLVISFPMWWGGEPALLKGLIDRLLLPGFAFKYHDEDPWWDRLLAGRSADVIISTDTPPVFLRFAYGNAVIKRWRGQILGFCGFRPVRFLVCGPIRQGGVRKRIAKWTRRIEKMASSIKQAEPAARQGRLADFLNRSHGQARSLSHSSNS